jgi:thiamine-phosphate pyrophosphorylase
MLPRLLLLTDRSQLRLGRSLVTTVRECVDAGLAAVVVREHDLAPAARSALVAQLASLDGLTVISSRIADPAAHGLHEAAGGGACNAVFESLGQPSTPTQDARTPRYSWRGRSCHTPDEVRQAAADGIDYATLSPYAATASKPGYGRALGPKPYGATWPIPVFALGGIDVDNAAQAVEAGAHGIAVMGAVMRAGDPAETIAALLAELAP